MKRYGSKTLHSGLRHALFSKTASARIPACTGTGCTLAAQFSKRNVLLDRTSKFCMFSFLLFSLGAFAADPRITAKRKLVSNQYESIEAMFDGCDVSGFKKSDIEEVNGVLVGTGISSGVSFLGGATSVVSSSLSLANKKLDFGGSGLIQDSTATSD
ncbi:MAG: hypothetical protein LBL52_03240, partial [Rickettsiales bacterium]|nr:hypothetical protein [Rickettsiales bacterium]